MNTLTYVGAEPRGYWVIQAGPAVMTRVKRVFGRVKPQRSGAVHITDTPEVARDLEWLLARYPLTLTPASQRHLSEQADAHRAREETVAAILNGTHTSLELAEPARAPRPYQQTAADLAIATGRLLVADDVGLGKSMTGTLVLRAPDALPALVVTLTHLPQQWVEEIGKTLPWLRCHILSKGTPYPLGDPAPDVLVTNYHKLAGWAGDLTGAIRTVIFDEAQELRRGDESAKWTAAAQIADGAHYRVGLTASPVYNYGGEIHNVLTVLAPDALGTRDEFLREWGGGGDKGAVRKPAELGQHLRDEGLLIKRTRAEVGRELPDVVRVTQFVQADEKVLDQVKGNAAELARLILSSTASNTDRWRASSEIDWTMRQATGLAKAPFVAEFIRLLLESEERVVLFGWHRAVYDLWAERLAEFNPVFYTGEESPKQKAEAAAAFTAGDARILVMSLRAGAGLDGLQDTAHVAVFGELDWSPAVHMQCIGRLHRDGQAEPVVAYFLVSEHGSDPSMAEVLQLKRAQAEPMLTPDGELFDVVSDTTDRVKALARSVLGITDDEQEAAS